MCRMVTAFLILALAQPPVATPPAPGPVSPNTWVAFSADIRITRPNRPEAWGRYVQDQHGCVRQDMIHPDGSALTTITNFQTEQMYRLMRGAWTSQPMRVGPMARVPVRLSVTGKADPIEAFDAYVHESNVRSPRGDYKQVVTVIPALNFFRADFTTPSGERRQAVNIRTGAQDHDQFLPPAAAVVTQEPGFGGYMSFTAVVLRLAFAGQPPIEATTTEENAYALKTPSGIPLTLVTSVIDPVKQLVRIRVLTNATGSPGNVRGDLIEEVQIPLGGTGQTSKLGETLSIAVTRVGMAGR